MVDLDGMTFMKDEIHEMIRSSRRLSASGATIYVTAIFGGHLGKSKTDLLNYLFGCCFVGIDGCKHRYDGHLKEKIMWALECSVPNSLVAFQVAELRKWFGAKQFDGFQNYKIAATGFSFSTEILWKQIIEDTKLDLPAHMDMVSCYLCDEAKKQCLTMLNSDGDFLSLKRTESPQEFSDKLEPLLGCLINRYKVETETCSEELRDKMENELIEDIIRDTSTYSEKLVTELRSKMYDSSVQRILSASEADPYFDVHGLVESCLNEFTNAYEVLLARYPTILSEITSAMESDLLAYEEKVQSMQIKMMEKTLEKERSEPENVQLSMVPLNLEGANIATEREDAFKKIELSRVKNYIEFSRWELKKATNNFNKPSMIGEGGFGIVYKGFLRNTTVAIKVPKPGTCQGDEFNQEVEILSKIRHPNLISFLGANTEAQNLVFEFLPNGSLDDFLAKGENSSRKLFWQNRIRIASEICSALIFLHSIKPHDTPMQTTKTITPFNFTQNPKGSMGYIDPEYFCGELTPQSDVFAFGIILLQLVTDRSPIGLIRIVEDALDKHKL